MTVVSWQRPESLFLVKYVASLSGYFMVEAAHNCVSPERESRCSMILYIFPQNVMLKCPFNESLLFLKENVKDDRNLV